MEELLAYTVFSAMEPWHGPACHWVTMGLL